MANRSTRRAGTPASLPLNAPTLSSSSNLAPPPATHQKWNVSVEEWERKAPLTDLQLRSVAKVKTASERNTIPLKFAVEPSDPGTPTPTRPNLANKLLQSRPGTPARSGTPKHSQDLHPAHPVQTPQQFYDWYALIDRSVAHSQEAHYRAHVAALDEHLSVCRLVEERITQVERQVDEMTAAWTSVEEGGKSLKGACERLLEERDGLLAVMDEIGGHLEYFQELEHATRMLNHPGEALIFQADFLYMVERVDICIEFLKTHRHYREAEVYLLRFQQCMTRAMTLIKMNFVGSLRALSSEISKRLADKDISPTAQHHLLYTRFKSVAGRIAPLLEELERRSLSYPDELNALLAECHQAYFSTRKALLVPRIMEEIRGLDPGKSDLVELTREGCGYLKQLCTEEWALYREFFSAGEDLLYQFLETLCDLLYDDLRPRILHEPRLTVLCEVCTVLQALMILDASASTPSSSSALFAETGTPEDSDASSDPDSDSDADSNSNSQYVRGKRGPSSSDELSLTLDPHSGRKAKGNKVGRRLHISHLLKMVLQDAQTRLFFKAQAVIQSEIRHYVPRAEDLRWPEVLTAANNVSSGTEIREKESTSQIFTNVAALQQKETWYPTLKTTVWVLSQLHDFVKPEIFEDIAQEALSYCRLSLVAAADNIRTRGGGGAQAQAHLPQLDGCLFLVRHLLILKDVIASLDELRLREDGFGLATSSGTASNDWSGRDGRKMSSGTGAATSPRPLEMVRGVASGGGVTETLANMLNRTTSLLPEGLFASLGVARGPETDMRGVKQDIDQSLRQGCEDAIAASVRPICAPLETWSASMGPSTSASVPGASGTASTPAPPPTSIQALKEQAPDVQRRFLEAVHRDLRDGVWRVRLYLGDERTAKVLVEHIVARVTDAYERWGDAVRVLFKEQLPAELDVLSSARLSEVLRDATSTS